MQWWQLAGALCLWPVLGVMAQENLPAGPCTLEVRAPQAAAYRLQRGAQHAATPVSNVLASPQLRALQQRLAAGEGSQAFWHQLAQQGSPLVERDGVQPPLAANEVLLTFLWRGARHGVTLLGAPSAGHDPLHRLADSDVWYRSYRVPASLRLSYQLAPDAPPVAPAWRREALLAVAQRDPLNRQTFPPQALDDFDARSVLTLPAALPAPWLAASTGQGAWQQAWLPAAQAGGGCRPHKRASNTVSMFTTPSAYSQADPKTACCCCLTARRCANRWRRRWTGCSNRPACGQP